MAKLKGRGVSAVNYPTGMNLGGDPTQALVHSTPTGNFMVSLYLYDDSRVTRERILLPYEVERSRYLLISVGRARVMAG